MVQTIQETVEELHKSLQEYIEATYHISSPKLIEQRKELLKKAGVISQIPYLESTPRYLSGETFESIEDLPDAALEIFLSLSKSDKDSPQLLYNPPYKHQAEAIKKSLIEGRNLVIMTGTGSGKTESFLLPILGKFAREAKQNPSAFKEQHAIRALILYPMNALVNDQLGRLRSLLGDKRLVASFKSWANRPPLFARYTSRTPYAGVRTADKDRTRLKSFGDFYVDIQQKALEGEGEEKDQAIKILQQLKERGKWPAKPDLIGWFGKKGKHWQDKAGNFTRAITLPDDSELLTRHEIQSTPPDLLVTNYSMLEYMLMRPIERTIFDQTQKWLAKNPDEKFLIVLDEAHLYRGAAGAEVGLLLRRLRERLNISESRFQVICATASFQDTKSAPEFGAQLTGTSAETFVPIKGDYNFKIPEGCGSLADAEALAKVDLVSFYEAKDDEERIKTIQSLLEYTKTPPADSIEVSLHQALNSFPPMGLLINKTMKEARPLSELGSGLFPDAPQKVAETALSALMALGSIARLDPKGAGLLPCRIHNFFRGLPGLWVCIDDKCSEVPESQKNSICGKMYHQPREICDCGARVLEFFTCRNCGTAYARAYTDNLEDPKNLWSEPGVPLRVGNGELALPLQPVDILLEKPRVPGSAELVEYDLLTGKINPENLGARMRQVYLPTGRLHTPAEDEDEPAVQGENGLFIPCPVCGKAGTYGRSSVQDHQTKGDQPFQALVTKQIQIQPPSLSKVDEDFAPLRGRKVLIFSDSRQVAARLAPNLQMFSVRDSLRALIAWGYKQLQVYPSLHNLLCLDDLYFSVLLASQCLKVRLRPELKTGETFSQESVAEAVKSGLLQNESEVSEFCMEKRNETLPISLLEDIINAIQHPYYGFEALAIASIVERGKLTKTLENLPSIPGIAETPQAKVALARTWLRCWEKQKFWLRAMPSSWSGEEVKGKKGSSWFKKMDIVLGDKNSKKIFKDKWQPELIKIFTSEQGGMRRLEGKDLSFSFEGDWVRCENCISVHRPMPNLSLCLDCGSDKLYKLDPDSDAVFLARNGYYRKAVISALSDPPQVPIALIAAEHTAQLNASQSDDVFSKAEKNELLFQDVPFAHGNSGQQDTAIDVLSSTTTMEVGIDIGALSGVALRNMPPGRANYQQRAGRAGRRGNAVATVIAFGSSDSHDNHYFIKPDAMIRGPVVDPTLALDNPDIARRHIRAFLLQKYHQERIPKVDPEHNQDLFSVLGTVAEFRTEGAILNYTNFSKWLSLNEESLRTRIAGWIPKQLSETDTSLLLSTFKEDCLKAIAEAIEAAKGEEAEEVESEDIPEAGEEKPKKKDNSGKLLDRLLYRGVLPRYAFPTDVATFHVFDKDNSTDFRPILSFSPSQSLPIALTQYAPGKQIWISNKCYTSGAIYSLSKNDRANAWRNREWYLECRNCGYAKTLKSGQANRGEAQDCTACGEPAGLGPARPWLRPVGFAHPVDVEVATSPDSVPESTYATRAKLEMGFGEAEDWIQFSSRLRALKRRQELLVSNTGIEKEGYSYCTECGRIETSKNPTPILNMPHRKPYPDQKEPICNGSFIGRQVVLGTKFITDIALFNVRVDKPFSLKPGEAATNIALRTVSEALVKAASKILEIEPGELMAEFRPALTIRGQNGFESEIFIYDTLSGGAGFSSQLAEKSIQLFQEALLILKDCPGQCDNSCYQCLRSFKNKFEHGSLDRHLGAQLIEFLLGEEFPDFDTQRLQASARILYSDLIRMKNGQFSFQLEALLNLPVVGEVTAPILATDKNGESCIIAISSPLASNHPADSKLREVQESMPSPRVIVVNEILVRKNIARATQQIQQKLAE